MAAERPTRFVGLDIHKAYFVAIGVTAAQEPVFGPQRVENRRLEPGSPPISRRKMQWCLR
jgi:hypothetical protein